MICWLAPQTAMAATAEFACKPKHWCHITKHSPDQYTVRWAPQQLWEQVAHVDPSVANPTVSEYTRKQARRHQQKRVDGKRFYG